MRLIRTGSVVFAGLVVVLLGLPAQAAVTPISTCDFAEAPGTYKVTQDSGGPCTGSGIVIDANNVTIDLNGHTVTGDRTPTYYGIDDSGGHKNLTVENGTVEKFDTGVFGSVGADGMHVKHVVVAGNTMNGIDVTGDSVRVTSSQVSGNHNDGMNIFGSSVRVASSQASGNGSVGIYVSGSSGQVTSSQASGNGDIGVLIGGDFARVKSSRASGNAGHGIEVEGNASKIGQLPGGPVSDRNHADANGFVAGASNGGLGIHGSQYTTTAPVGHNEASGNDDARECDPANLCK